MDVIGNYLRLLHDTKIYKEHEKRELIRKAQQGDKEARNKIITSHLRFTLQKVAKMCRSRQELEDMFSYSHFIMIKAIKKFSLDSGWTFCTYLGKSIENSVLRYIPECKYQIRIPIGIYEELMKKGRGKKYKERSVAKYDRGGKVVASLDAEVSEKEGATSLYSIIGDTATKDVPQHDIKYFLNNLTDIERLVITERRLKEKTLQQVAEVIGRSRERVRQIEKATMKKLVFAGIKEKSPGGIAGGK